MTSSPGLLGLNNLQARCGVLQTMTTAPESKTILAPTLCVGGPVKTIECCSHCSSKWQ